MRRLRFFGHPLHPATVHFPIGLLVGATVVDVLAVLGLDLGPKAANLLLILGLCAAAALGLYGASLWLRNVTESTVLVLTTSLGGAFVLLFAGWLGGQLVYRHGQGVESPRSRP